MTLVHRVEHGLARAGLGLFRALGPVAASNLGGWVARALGPWLPTSRVAEVNLRLALPGLAAGARRRIIRGVWENLGRTVGEFPHLVRLREYVAGTAPSGPCWWVEGMEHIDAVMARGGPAILISAHMGNWELMPLSAVRHGLDFGSFYRAADNEAVDAMILGLRTEDARPPKWFPKGSAGAKSALQHMAKGGYLGVLADQKLNDGVAATFFGQRAMTAPATATLSVRLKCPVVPVYVRRDGPARLAVVVEAPMEPPASGDRAADIAGFTQAINDRIEGWVRARPESWLWLHRRFEKAAYRR